MTEAVQAGPTGSVNQVHIPVSREFTNPHPTSRVPWHHIFTRARLFKGRTTASARPGGAQT
jgi:hypothetical protein